MKKGHATIAIEVAKLAKVDLPHIQSYISNFNSIADSLIDYYGIEGKLKPTRDQIKWCFNMMIYGGGFNSWGRDIQLGDKDYLPVQLKNIDNVDDLGNIIPHPLIANFKTDCHTVTELIYKNNPKLLKMLNRVDRQLEEHELKNRLTSYFFQIIENHCLYLLYNFLVNKRIISKNECELEYDGICIPPIPFPIDKDTLTEEINQMILDNTGMNIKYCFKDYDPDFVQATAIQLRLTNTIETINKISEVGYDNDDENDDLKTKNLEVLFLND